MARLRAFPRHGGPSVKRVLLTGASGFIGRHCVSSLQERGYEVHAVHYRHQSPGDPRVVWHNADLLDPAALSCLFSGVSPTHLLHLAWYAAPGDYITSSENLRWVDASMEMLRRFREEGGRRVVVAGSCFE